MGEHDDESRGRPDDEPGYGADRGTDSDDHDSWAVPDDDPGPVPEEWEIEGPAVSISLGDAADLDPALLAAITGPGGLGGEFLGPQFGQDHAADALRPGPVLAALTEQAVADAATLTDDQLTGALQAARRNENRAAWQQTMLTAELARRRRAQHHDAIARHVPRGSRPGEFPADELAAELLITRTQAEHRIDNDLNLTSRLPATLAAMAAGTITGPRADLIAFYTASLSDTDTAFADEILAAAAPGLRYDQLARKAAALEIKLDPQAARARREHAKTTRQRVEAGREDSGNAYLSGRELATADVLASKAHIDAIAARLRRAGHDGTLDQLRALALTDLTQGRNPLDRITPTPGPDIPAPGSSGPGTSGPGTSGPGTSGPGTSGPGTSDTGTPGPAPAPAGPPVPRPTASAASPRHPSPGPHPDCGPDFNLDASLDFEPDPDPAFDPPPAPGRPGPLPALINLTVPAGTLLGWSTAPAQASGWGLLDADETRDIVAAASRHPRTRWCFTFTGPDGTAIAHGCSPGQHPWTPPDSEAPRPRTPPSGPPAPRTPSPPAPPRTPSPPAPPPTPGSRRGNPGPRPGPGPGPSPSPAQAAQLRDLMRALKITPEPIARSNCDHRHAEDRYSPSRKLQHLTRARTAVCTAPGCGAQAVYADLDHTTPYPDGPTCECNIAPACRRHHRCKQAPDWALRQPQPGTMAWTTPAGRTYATYPTTYDY